MQTGKRFIDEGHDDELQSVTDAVWRDYCANYGRPDADAGCQVDVAPIEGDWKAELLGLNGERLAVYQVNPRPDGKFTLALVFARTPGTGRIRLVGGHEEESE